jgi:hypothetical protein
MLRRDALTKSGYAVAQIEHYDPNYFLNFELMVHRHDLMLIVDPHQVEGSTGPLDRLSWDLIPSKPCVFG